MAGLTPNHVDLHVGAIMRQRRLALGMSQSALADALGVSFQQVQKYENGANRVSASMLYYAAKAQGLPPAAYFEGLPDVEIADTSKEGAEIRAWLSSKEGWSLAEAVVGLSKTARATLLQFIRDLRPRD